MKTRINLSLVFLTVLLTTCTLMAQVPSGLVLWNQLGSVEQVTNSEVGLNGTQTGGSFMEGVFGNAFVVQNSQFNQVTFPKEVVPIEEGCIELWVKLIDYPAGLPWGHHPELIGVNDGTRSYAIHLNGNDGAGNGGLCGRAGGGVCTPIGCGHHSGTGTYGSWSYEDVFGVGQVANWHHLALVWDKNGITGVDDGTRIVATFLDGVMQTGRWHSFPGTTLEPLTGGALGLLRDVTTTLVGKTAFDNLKIWNYAKTDFSDRFIEGYACAIPQNLNAEIVSPSQAELTWDAVPGAFGYRIQGRRAGGTDVKFLASATNSKTLVGSFNPGDQFEWRVRSACSNDTSAWSAVGLIDVPVPELELVASFQHPGSIQVGSINGLEASALNPDILYLSTMNVGAYCGGGTEASMFKAQLDPVSGLAVSVDFKQTMTGSQQVRHALLEGSDGTILTGSGWCGITPPYYSIDGGETYAPANTGTVYPPYSVFSLEEFNGELYAGTGYEPYHGQVYHWLGSGLWELAYDLGTIQNIVTDLEAFDGKLFVASLPYGISGNPCASTEPSAMSSDGVTFTSVTGLPSCFTVDEMVVVGDRLIACARNRKNTTRSLWEFDKISSTWNYHASFPIMVNESVPVMLEAVGEVLFTAGKFPGDTRFNLLRSIDYGLTWASVGDIWPDYTIVDAGEDVVYVGTNADASGTAYLYRYVEPTAAPRKATVQELHARAYPSPATDKITIVLQGASVLQGSPALATAELQVYDAVGRLVQVAPFTDQLELDLSKWALGMYFYRITSQTFSASGQFIKN